jgi:proteasome lid subunit RPN8/RPN11
MRVRILPPSLAKVINHSITNPKIEVAGLLLGMEEDDTIEIWDSVTGEQMGSSGFVVLSEEVMARVAEYLQAYKIPLYIVGWYHSHPSLGLFLSPIDIRTQLTYQTLYPKAVALVIDPARYLENKKVTDDVFKVFQVAKDGGVVEVPVTFGAGRRKLLESTLISLSTTAIFGGAVEEKMNVNPLKMLGGIISQGRNRAGGKRHE